MCLLRQGSENGAGAKHSLYVHYGTTKGVINADDLLLMPDVIANGERTENGKKAISFPQAEQDFLIDFAGEP